MNKLAQVDPNILFRRIRNQFLAAIIGIIILVIFGISYAITLNAQGSEIYFAISALVIVSILAAFMVIKLNDGGQRLKEIDEQHKISTAKAAHKIWRLIVGLGEACLESNVPDHRRTFVANALSQVIENEMETLGDDELSLKSILAEIKSESDSEVNQKKTFNEVLARQKKIKEC